MDSGWESVPITALVLTAWCAAVQMTGRTSYSLVQQMYHPRFGIKNEGKGGTLHLLSETVQPNKQSELRPQTAPV